MTEQGRRNPAAPGREAEEAAGICVGGVDR